MQLPKTKQSKAIKIKNEQKTLNINEEALIGDCSIVPDLCRSLLGLTANCSELLHYFPTPAAAGVSWPVSVPCPVLYTVVHWADAQGENWEILPYFSCF